MVEPEAPAAAAAAAAGMVVWAAVRVIVSSASRG